jgi:hypothetical protein
MARYSAVHRIAPHLCDEPAATSQPRSLSSAFLAGLAMYALAANGTCTAVLEACGEAAPTGGDQDPRRTQPRISEGMPQCRR